MWRVKQAVQGDSAISSGGVAVRGRQRGAAVGRGSARTVLQAESVLTRRKCGDRPARRPAGVGAVGLYVVDEVRREAVLHPRHQAGVPAVHAAHPVVAHAGGLLPGVARVAHALEEVGPEINQVPARHVGHVVLPALHRHRGVGLQPLLLGCLNTREGREGGSFFFYGLNTKNTRILVHVKRVLYCPSPAFCFNHSRTPPPYLVCILALLDAPGALAQAGEHGLRRTDAAREAVAALTVEGAVVEHGVRVRARVAPPLEARGFVEMVVCENASFFTQNSTRFPPAVVNRLLSNALSAAIE